MSTGCATLYPVASRGRRIAPRCPRLPRGGGVSHDHVPGLQNGGAVSHNDVPGLWIEAPGGSFLWTAVILRRWNDQLRSRVTGICKVATPVWLLIMLS